MQSGLTPEPGGSKNRGVSSRPRSRRGFCPISSEQGRAHAVTQIHPPGPSRCRGEIQELGQVGPGRRNRYAQLHEPGGHRRGGAAGAQGQGDFARAQFRPARPAGRQDQISPARPHQSAAHDAAHRHRCLLRRARQARHPRRRRSRRAAAAVRHPVGRARPHLLRELHVERLRLPRGVELRRRQMRHRKNQAQDGRPRRVPRRAARARP